MHRLFKDHGDCYQKDDIDGGYGDVDVCDDDEVSIQENDFYYDDNGSKPRKHMVEKNLHKGD